jgi:hypothetical protein
LRFVDAPGLKNAWQPHVYYGPQYDSGKIHFSIDFMNSKEAPADFYIEFRDWEKELFVGPTFRVTQDGAFYVNGLLGAGGEQVATVPAGEWCNVTIDFTLGQEADGAYTLKLSVPGKQSLEITRPFGHPSFRKVTWLGISSTSTERTVFYVDNVILGIAESEALKNAAASRAIKGPGKAVAEMKTTLSDPDRLVGHWKCDVQGFELTDISGNGLTGDLGGVKRARGDFGCALYIDDSGAVATIPDCPLLQFSTDDFSIECWLYPLSLDVASAHKRRRIIEKLAYPATWWNVDLWSDGRLQMEMKDENGTNGTTVSADAIQEKTWTHVVITVDRKNFTTSYYFNGQLDSAREIPRGFTGSLNVGGRNLSTGTWQPYVGLLSDLRIYRRVLRPDEIMRSYEAARNRYVSGSFEVLWDE